MDTCTLCTLLHWNFQGHHIHELMLAACSYHLLEMSALRVRSHARSRPRRRQPPIYRLLYKELIDGVWQDWPFTYFHHRDDARECMLQRRSIWQQNRDPDVERDQDYWPCPPYYDIEPVH